MNARRIGIVTILAALLVVAVMCPNSDVVRHAQAAEPLRREVEYERVSVPADQPAAWPKEINRLIPVPRQEFNSLIEQLNSLDRGPRSTWLKSAHYEATLLGDALQGGLMTASVQRLAGRSALLELGPVSFAFEDLKWQDRAAIWGSSADGRTWLLTDGRNDELLGEWSCRGRSFPGGIDFDLLLPPATISFLDLRVPKGFSVLAPSAEVALLGEASAEGTRLWRIHCGGDSRCRVTFVSRTGIEAGRRALMVEHDMQVVVREEDLRFQLERGDIRTANAILMASTMTACAKAWVQNTGMAHFAWAANTYRVPA